MHLDYTFNNFSKLQRVEVVFEYVLLRHYSLRFLTKVRFFSDFKYLDCKFTTTL